jgi:MFS transporter, FSR family, fosmidomycin resistance protein
MTKILLLYSTLHALVDASSAYVIYSLYTKHLVVLNSIFALVVLYNLLAFGLQPLLGILSDYVKKYKLFSCIGLFLVIISLSILTIAPILSVWMVGIGNAIFHIGGGSYSLKYFRNKYTSTGIFVGPGAVGLGIGILLGKSNYPVVFFLIPILLVFLGILSKTTERLVELNIEIRKTKLNNWELIFLLLMISAVIRSAIGLGLSFSWKTHLPLLIVAIFTTAAGKMIGGVLAQRYGWKRVMISSLSISALFLAFYKDNPILALMGIGFFQITMPITLVGVYNIFPTRPGFSFGLVCLALLFGAIPTFNGWNIIFENIWIVFVTIILSAFSIFVAMNKFDKIKGYYEK